MTELNTPGRITREVIFMTSCLLSSAYQASYEKRSTLIGRNLFPRGAKSFLLEVTLSQKGSTTIWNVTSLEILSAPIKYG